MRGSLYDSDRAKLDLCRVSVERPLPPKKKKTVRSGEKPLRLEIFTNDGGIELVSME
jgi:hypothetical protein